MVTYPRGPASRFAVGPANLVLPANSALPPAGESLCKRNDLRRDASHRKALFMNLCPEVINHERIQTTEAKAKAVKPSSSG